jgi:hypothetical protein
MLELTSRLNPEGCQKVTGGRREAKTIGEEKEIRASTLKGCQSFLTPFQGVESFSL